jgi:HSP20 family protein
MNLPSIFKHLDTNFDEVFYNTYNYDVETLEDKYLIYMDVPGVTKENVTVKLVNGLLTVVAERKGNRAATFRNTFKLPNNANGEVAASLEAGVLTLTVSKTEASKTKLIEVK